MLIDDAPEARLREIEERCERATKGPWLREDGEFAYVVKGDGDLILFNTDNTNDRDFVQHARADIPWLLALVARLRRERC